MSNEHMCPRRDEGAAGQIFTGPDTWRPNGTCSFCGSMNPDTLMELLESGGAELGPTDKSYKVYVSRLNPIAGQIIRIGSDSGPAFDRAGMPSRSDLTPEEIKANHYHRDITGPAAPMTHEKFYFRHLSDDQRKRFVELLNEKRLKIGYPGHFYALPFFCVRASS